MDGSRSEDNEASVRHICQRVHRVSERQPNVIECINYINPCATSDNMRVIPPCACISAAVDVSRVHENECECISLWVVNEESGGRAPAGEPSEAVKRNTFPTHHVDGNACGSSSGGHSRGKKREGAHRHRSVKIETERDRGSIEQHENRTEQRVLTRSRGNISILLRASIPDP